MFARIFALLPLALLVSASHLEARDQCNTGPAQCCDTQTASQASGLLAQYSLVGLLAPDSLVGTNCSPLSVVSAASGCNAQQQPVCCNGNTWDGLVNIGCDPINVFA